ncbi:extracellular solute-binding protein [Scatolibacter rhodanostii]|uniref:extracellular solute-binding protein n=1 Tax=Scatolibacter rhodanostii TaxID=2014781 RepID=UPI0013562E2F|nr:extracellular solute-binding protein [Scatolibacter rhodanostii]
MKKFIALMTAMLMVLSLAACGGDTDKSSVESKSSAAESSSDTSVEGTADTEGPLAGVEKLAGYDDPFEITVFIRDNGEVPADSNPVIQKIEEMTGVTMKYEFLVGDLNQKLGVMIAGGEYPDTIFAGDQASSLIEAGAFIPLEDEITKYENLNALYGKMSEYMKSEDGHIYTLDIYSHISSDVVEAAPTFESGIGFFIQKAVLEDAGYPTPKTIEEYFELIKNYKEKNPEIDGVKTVGFEMLADGWRNWSLVNPVQNLMGASNDGALYVDPDTLKSSFYQTSDLAKTYYKQLNQAYQDGLIEPESLTQNYDQYIAKLTSGAVLGFYDQTWNSDAGVNVLKNDGKYNRTYIAVPITADGTGDGYVDAESGIPSTVNGVGITVNSQNKDRILAYYDWLLQREVQDYLAWGEEGTDWVYNEDKTGKEFTAERRAIENDTAKKRDLTGHTLRNYTPKWVGVYKDDGMATGSDKSIAEKLASLSEYDQEFLKAYDFEYPAEMLSAPILRPAYYPIWAMTIEDGSAAAVSATKITDVTVKYFPQLILATDDAAYEATWNEFVEAFNAIDLNAYQSEVDRQIDVKMTNDAEIQAKMK